MQVPISSVHFFDVLSSGDAGTFKNVKVSCMYFGVIHIIPNNFLVSAIKRSQLLYFDKLAKIALFVTEYVTGLVL